MKKLLIDTNIILDLLGRRIPFHKESEQIFSLSDTKKVKLYISTLSIANSHYILSDVMKIKDAKNILSKFKVLVNSISLSDKIIDLALSNDKFKDFEDGIQYYSAIEENCDFIITRNIKDYKASMIPVLKPKEYLSQIKAQK